MINLQPVDFKAVAAKGAYVYGYFSASGSLYYIGMSTLADGRRPFERHACPLPAYDALVRVFRSGLTKDEAIEWEKFYIARFGRICDGGQLQNQALGGDGNWGYKHTEETKQHLAEACKQFANVVEQTKTTAEQLATQGVCTVSEYQAMDYKDRQAFRKYLQRNPEGSLKVWQKQTHSEYSRQGAMKRSAATAARVGASLDQWLQLTDSSRTAVKAWLKRNPAQTFDDWINGVRQRQSGPKGQFAAA